MCITTNVFEEKKEKVFYNVLMPCCYSEIELKLPELLVNLSKMSFYVSLTHSFR